MGLEKKTFLVPENILKIRIFDSRRNAISHSPFAYHTHTNYPKGEEHWQEKNLAFLPQKLKVAKINVQPKILRF